MSNVPKNKKEILVRAPFFIRTQWWNRPEVKAVEERLNFFSICGKISKYLAWPITVVSLVLLVFTGQGLLNPAQFSFPKPLLIVTMFFIGLMTILSGLLLLAKE